MRAESDSPRGFLSSPDAVFSVPSGDQSTRSRLHAAVLPRRQKTTGLTRIGDGPGIEAGPLRPGPAPATGLSICGDLFSVTPQMAHEIGLARQHVAKRSVELMPRPRPAFRSSVSPPQAHRDRPSRSYRKLAGRKRRASPPPHRRSPSVSEGSFSRITAPAASRTRAKRSIACTDSHFPSR